MAFSYDRDGVARASEGPADDMYALTGNNNADLPVAVRAFRASGAGDVHVITRSGSERTITVVAGEVITCGITKLFSTGTTATGILGYV